MAKTVADLLNSALAEWDHWGRSTWNTATGARHIGHTDDEAAFAQYAITNYCSIVGDQPTVDEIADDEYFWSAVGMTAIFKGAGFVRTEFPFSNRHSTWIRAFVRARNAGQPALYHAYRLNEAQATPEVGDVIGYTYDQVTFAQAQTYFDKTTHYASHTDVVVAKRPGEIDVIGANVLDSVTKKTLALAPNGLLADRSHRWFVVLRRRGFDA